MSSANRLPGRMCLFGAMILAPLVVTSALRFGHDPVAFRAGQPLAHRADGFVGATACRACHPDQHKSWSHTWHSTMTQRASARSVLGKFDGTDVSFYGQVARPYEENGRYYMELPDGAGRRIAQVQFTVGSHRYQQYFEKVERGASGAVYRRLPILWHMDDDRWLHINGVFLDPDNPTWPREPAIWNENCIFCHNTAPQPRMLNFAAAPEDDRKAFDSHVADLGISCESCHGAGEDHVEAMRDPTARYASYFGGDVDLHIIQPTKLDKERAVSACGQCHGQRIPTDPLVIRKFLETGPTFRVGDRLEDHVQPLARSSEFGGQPNAFALRFWKDGTPRLTAYEYQGIVGSACYQRGSMTCGSCHSMHKGDRDGMIEPLMRTNHACTQCHEAIGRDVAIHTRHAADGSGSRCVSCHMPRFVYGVFGVRISHRIENPDPARDAAADRPNACTMCHLDKSLSWAGTETRRMFGSKYALSGRRSESKAALHTPDAVVAILSGDPVMRVVYAQALGREDAAPGDRAEGLLALLATLGDRYASVRDMARRSLLAREGRQPLGIRGLLERFNTLDGTPSERAAAVRALLSAFQQNAGSALSAPKTPSIVGANWAPDMQAIVDLLDQQSNKVISIGR